MQAPWRVLWTSFAHGICCCYHFVYRSHPKSPRVRRQKMEMRMKLGDILTNCTKLQSRQVPCTASWLPEKKTLIEWLLSLFHHMHAVVVRRQIFRSQVKRFNLECFAGKCCNGKCCRHLGIPWSWSWVSPFNYRCSHCSDAWTGYGYGWLWPMGGFVPVYCNCCRRF